MDPHAPNSPGPAAAPPARLTAGRVLRVVAVLAVLGFLCWRFIDLRELGRILVDASAVWVIATFAVAVLDYAIMGAKWNILLRVYDVRVPLVVPIGAYFRSQVFSLFIPSVLGMDAYRAYVLKRHGGRLLSVVSSIFVERFVGMLSSLAVIGVLLPFAFLGLAVRDRVWLAAAGWSGFVAIGAFLFLSLRFSGWLGHRAVIARLPAKLERRTRDFLKAVGSARHDRGNLVLYFALSCFEKLLYGTCVYMAARAIHLDAVSWLHFVAAIPLIALFERIPISVQALGIREGLFVVLLRPYGVDATSAVAIALIIRAVELGRVGLGVLFWLAEPRRAEPSEELEAVGVELAMAEPSRESPAEGASAC